MTKAVYDHFTKMKPYILFFHAPREWDKKHPERGKWSVSYIDPDKDYYTGDYIDGGLNERAVFDDLPQAVAHLQSLIANRPLV